MMDREERALLKEQVKILKEQSDELHKIVRTLNETNKLLEVVVKNTKSATIVINQNMEGAAGKLTPEQIKEQFERVRNGGAGAASV